MNDLEIANTFFDNVEDRSQFLKDVEYNMKVDAGIDTGVSNEQLTNEYNKNVEQTIDKATEDTLLNLNDPSQIGMVTSMFEAQYVANKADPEMTVQRMYTDKNIEEKLNNDGVYRVNYANGKKDASIWVTRYIYGLQQIADMYEHNSWDWHDAKRMFGPLALAGGTSLLKKSISSANPVGAFAGGLIGGIGYGGPLLWDYIALGDASFNVQRDVNNRFHDIVGNSKDFVKDIERLKADIQKYPKEYRGDIAKALTEGPDTFADMGNEMTGLGMATSMKFVAPAFNGAKAFSKKLFNKSLGKKSFQWNDKLADTIKQTITNSVDKEAIEARVDEHVTNTAPKDADDTTKETVKGIELNNENDRLLTANDTDDRVFAKPVNDNIPADEMLTPANDNESIFIEDPLVLREQPQPEPLFNDGARNLPDTVNDNTRELMAGEPMAVTSERSTPDVNKRRQNMLEAEKRAQRGEINLSGKDLKEEVIISHGRGVNNEPMTYEEAVETMKKLQGRQKAVDFDETDFQSLEVDENTPDFMALEAASRQPWGKEITDPGMADYNFADTGEGGQYYRGGLYFAIADLKDVSARYNYWYQFNRTSSGAYNKGFAGYKISETLADVVNSTKPKKSYFDSDVVDTLLERTFPEQANVSEIAEFESNLDTIKEFDKVFNLKVYQQTIDSLKFGYGGTGDNLAKVLRTVEDKGYSVLMDNLIDSYEMLGINGKELNESASKLITYFKDNPVKSKEFFKNSSKRYGYQDGYDDIRDLVYDFERASHNYLMNASTIGMIHLIDEKMFSKVFDQNIDVTKKIPDDTVLNTAAMKNPEKDLDGFLYWSHEKGLVPLASFYKGDAARIAEAKVNKALDSIYEDVAKQIELENSVEEIDEFYNIPEELKSLSTAKKLRYFVENGDGSQLRRFEGLEREALFYNIDENILEDVFEGDFRRWQKEYEKSKGLKAMIHKGSGASGNNIVVMDESILLPVNKVMTMAEENIPGNLTYAYDNAHWIEEAGDGAGYYVMERHAPQGSMPVILRDNKRVDNKK